MKSLHLTGAVASLSLAAALGLAATSTTATAAAGPWAGHAGARAAAPRTAFPPKSATSLTAPSATTAAANTSAAPDTLATPYYVCSPTLGCIGEPGHNNVVYVRSVRNIALNLVYQETTAGYAWYELQYNGTNECLNYVPANGFVYEDSCISDDPNEMWEHHYGNLLYNFTSGDTLSTCNNIGNSRLFASVNVPASCSFTSPDQDNWLFFGA